MWFFDWGGLYFINFKKQLTAKEKIRYTLNEQRFNEPLLIEKATYKKFNLYQYYKEDFR